MFYTDLSCKKSELAQALFPDICRESALAKFKIICREYDDLKPIADSRRHFLTPHELQLIDQHIGLP